MAKNFSLKLALNNIKNNRKFYLPYFVAATGIIAMFYIICFLSNNQDIEAMSSTLTITMGLGSAVMAVFAVIFLFYTNSFLMKRRKKEMGLYNILGMEKRHIGKILAIENLVISLASIGSGLAGGILFSKLVHLILSSVFRGDIPFGISVSGKAVIITLILFGALFTLTMFSNLMSIHLAKPIELLYGGNVGEKEPKSKWFLAAFGAVCLAVGYFIAITVDSPLTALFLFFIAVVLVIIGTYCLFIAGSIVLLKMLKRNRRIYYRPANFTAISGLIYRMKQNAAGLANICILSTMVLVMISGTVSLYAGMEDAINGRIPEDIRVGVECRGQEQVDRQEIHRIIEKVAKERQMNVVKYSDNQSLQFMAKKTRDNFKLEQPDTLNDSLGVGFVVVTADEYEKLTGRKLTLNNDQVAVFSRGSELSASFNLGGFTFQIKEKVDQFTVESLDAYLINVHYLVVCDESVLLKLYQLQQENYEGAASPISYYFDVAVDESEEAQEVFSEELREELEKAELGQYQRLTVENKEALKGEYYGLVGGFLFLGIFLGIVFTFAAALIIYYKQISEGYYDKEKFAIMQKVGMSKTEVKKTIHRQVLLVFFIPLIMAGIHVLAAFKMITKLLLIFSMTNVTLFALCTVITFLVFAVIYALVYMVTAREYYKIVG